MKSVTKKIPYFLFIIIVEDMKQMGLDFMEKNVPEFDRNNLRYIHLQQYFYIQ